MMWFFLVTDALLFAGFLVSYAFVRLAAETWPKQTDVFPMVKIAAMTFILITSSATMATAVGAAHRKDLRRAMIFVLLTAIGGALFLAGQVTEWATLIAEGARLTQNPWGPPPFAAFFFMMTGFHGTHVLIGVILLGIVTVRLARGKATGHGVEIAGLYWHFVDVVWCFIFPLFYLL
ncbi:MAG: cytochrome oxidase subunit III [Gemmatimonadetes bacterium]|nr:cytochrome oxidase subunit III [Gemmatimonadota bacterium]